MRWIKLLISLASTIFLVFLLGTSFKKGTTSLPPLGSFFCPFTGFWQNAESSNAWEKNQSLNFRGVKDEVKVVFDERLVPHIFAKNTEDALFVQGYITASHRLWQMDISTRATAGKLAEIFGEGLLERDKSQRRKGLLWAAEKAEAQWRKDKEGIKLIEAYIKGANAFINHLSPKDYPIEFKLMGYQPEPWSVLKAAIFYKSMEETLNSNEDDLEATNALNFFGKEAFEFLYPDRDPTASPIVPNGTQWNFQNENFMDNSRTDSSAIGGFYQRPFESAPKFIGSNNWAVAKWKTKNGAPILCNDPHLRLTLPSIWYEIQIHTPEYNVYGVSFPGIPGVMIGFNENTAWGSTNGGHDVKDWYKIQWADQTKENYLLDGQIKSVEKRIEKIIVKGQNKPVFDTVKYTVWGPVAASAKDSPYADMAMRWIAHDAGDDFIWKTFWQFNSAKNFDDFMAGADFYGHPIQNFVFASKNGDIGIRTSGYFPLKNPGQGRFIQDGSKSSNKWKGIVPVNQTPVVKNPDRGFVFSANQLTTDATYPYYYNGEFDEYRSKMLNRKLTEMNNITVEDMMKLQSNNSSILAEEALPLLLEHLDTTKLNTFQLGVTKILKEWNYSFDAKAAAPAIFDEWFKQFYQLLWDEIFEVKDSIELLKPQNWRTVALLKNEPTAVFFDVKKTPEREGPTEIVTQSLINTCDSLNTELLDPGFNWSNHKKTAITHMGRIDVFSIKDKELGGYKEALNAISSTNGPSWRMVVELGDTVKAWGVYPGGQSGNPASKFYSTGIDYWSEGKYFELFFMKSPDDHDQKTLFTMTFK